MLRHKIPGTHWEQRRSQGYSQIGWVREPGLLGAIAAACGRGEAALDLGCGAGAISRTLRGRFRRIVGVDASQAMLDAGEFDGIETRCSRIEDLGLVEEFDLVVMRNVLHCVEDPLVCLRVAARAVKPGGRMVIGEGVPPDHLVRKRYEDIFSHLEDRHTFSEGDLVTLMRQCGLKAIRVAPYFMEDVDLLDWIRRVAPTPESAREAERLHREADRHFWEVYEMREADGRLLMTWRFAIAQGRKPKARSAR